MRRLRGIGIRHGLIADVVKFCQAITDDPSNGSAIIKSPKIAEKQLALG